MLLCVILVGISTATPSRAQDTLIAAGASWRYLDNGSNQGVAWRDPGFADGAWSVGCRIINPATGTTSSMDEKALFVTE